MKPGPPNEVNLTRNSSDGSGNSSNIVLGWEDAMTEVLENEISEHQTRSADKAIAEAFGASGSEHAKAKDPDGQLPCVIQSASVESTHLIQLESLDQNGEEELTDGSEEKAPTSWLDVAVSSSSKGSQGSYADQVPALSGSGSAQDPYDVAEISEKRAMVGGPWNAIRVDDESMGISNKESVVTEKEAASHAISTIENLVNQDLPVDETLRIHSVIEETPTDKAMDGESTRGTVSLNGILEPNESTDNLDEILGPNESNAASSLKSKESVDEILGPNESKSSRRSRRISQNESMNESKGSERSHTLSQTESMDEILGPRDSSLSNEKKSVLSDGPSDTKSAISSFIGDQSAVSKGAQSALSNGKISVQSMRSAPVLSLLSDNDQDKSVLSASTGLHSEALSPSSRPSSMVPHNNSDNQSQSAESMAYHMAGNPLNRIVESLNHHQNAQTRPQGRGRRGYIKHIDSGFSQNSTFESESSFHTSPSGTQVSGVSSHSSSWSGSQGDPMSPGSFSQLDSLSPGGSSISHDGTSFSRNNSLSQGSTSFSSHTSTRHDGASFSRNGSMLSPSSRASSFSDNGIGRGESRLEGSLLSGFSSRAEPILEDPGATTPGVQSDATEFFTTASNYISHFAATEIIGATQTKLRDEPSLLQASKNKKTTTVLDPVEQLIEENTSVTNEKDSQTNTQSVEKPVDDSTHELTVKPIAIEVSEPTPVPDVKQHTEPVKGHSTRPDIHAVEEAAVMEKTESVAEEVTNMADDLKMNSSEKSSSKRDIKALVGLPPPPPPTPPPQKKNKSSHKRSSATASAKPLKQVEEGDEQRPIRVWEEINQEGEASQKITPETKPSQLAESLMARTRSQAQTSTVLPSTSKEYAADGSKSKMIRVGEKHDERFIVNTTIAHKRVSVMQLLAFGLLGLLVGFLGSLWIQSSCHFVSAKVAVGDDNQEFDLHYGLWKYTPIESAFQGYSYCFQYDDEFTNDTPYVSRIATGLATIGGAFSLIVLWCYLIFGRASRVFWDLAVRAAFMAGILQISTLFILVGPVCRRSECSLGPAGNLSVLTSTVYFILSFEMYYNSPIQAWMEELPTCPSAEQPRRMIESIDFPDIQDSAFAYAKRLFQVRPSMELPTLNRVTSPNSTHNRSYKPPSFV